MTISSLKDLEKLLKLARSQGVTELEVDGIKMTLGDLPQKSEKPASARFQDNFQGMAANDPIQMPDHLTGEALLFYSSDAPTEQN